MQDFHSGRLENETDFDIIFRTGMQVGEFWPVTIFTVYCGYVFIEKGDREGLMQMLHRLQEIADSFENSHARSQMHRLNVLGYLRFRHLDKLLEQTGEAIDCTQKTGHFTALLIIWSAKAIAHSLRNELPAAKAAFAEAEKLIPDKKIIPMYYAHYLQARAYIELAELAQTEESQLSFGQKADKLKLTLRRLRKLSRSLATSAVETWRLWGSMQFITGKYRKALRSYSRSIEVGQQMGSNLELSRTYLEVGKFLLNPKSKSNSLLGISGNEYLLKAKAMMEELDLQWDLASYHSYLDS
jgi:tetratricopeptide (TPR) repeat protein